MSRLFVPGFWPRWHRYSPNTDRSWRSKFVDIELFRDDYLYGAIHISALDEESWPLLDEQLDKIRP